jgi:PilZ domain
MAEAAARNAGTIENRRYHRSTVLWPATLVWRRNTYDCIIFNISANGAKVMIKDASEEMKMVTLCSGRFGEFEGEVVWRGQGAIGMRFSAPPEEVARALGDTLPRLYEGSPAQPS